jgi:threonine/homoserine/homoserine lactone efflux protein
MLSYFIQGVTYGFAAAVQPGPLMIYLISQTLSNGWRRTLPAVFAPLITDGPIIALVLLVLSRIPFQMIQILQVAGGFFVLYLAAGALKAWMKFDMKSVLPQSSQQNLFRAVLINVLSPGPYLFWSLVLGPIFLTGWRDSPANGIGLLVGFYSAFITSMAITVLLFAITKRLGSKVSRALIGISALGLVGMGFYQIWVGLGQTLR